MRSFATLLVIAAFSGTLVAEEKAKAKPKFDAEKLVGKWKLTEGVKMGMKSEAKNLDGATVTITKDKITIEGGGEKHVMKYKIDATKSPVHIDMEGEEGPASGIKAEGIIAIDGDTVKLAYGTGIPGFEGKRPEKFESTKENKAFYFVMKKAK